MGGEKAGTGKGTGKRLAQSQVASSIGRWLARPAYNPHNRGALEIEMLTVTPMAGKKHCKVACMMLAIPGHL